MSRKFLSVLFFFLLANFSLPLSAARFLNGNPFKRTAIIRLSPSEAKVLRVGDGVLMKAPGYRDHIQGKIVRKNRRRIKLKVYINFHMLNKMTTYLVARETRSAAPNATKLVERKKRHRRSWGFLSLFGEVSITTESGLLFGGTVGLQITNEIEVEGHYGLGEGLEERSAIIEQRNLTALQTFETFAFRGRLFVWEYWNLSAGYRQLTISEEKSLQLIPLGEGQTNSDSTNEDEQFNFLIPSYSADHGFFEVGIGLRFDIQTLALGKAFSIGFDGVYSHLLSTANSTNIDYHPFDDVIGISGAMLSGRGYAGIVF